MLLAITTNPAIDRTLVVPGFRRAEVTRAAERHDAAGGKGLNVARVAGAIDLPVRACAPLGGPTGRRIAELASADGLDARWFWMNSGESRICLLITDPEAQDTLVINENGPPMAEEDWRGFAALVRAEAAETGGVSFSGSLMPGVSAEAFAALLGTLIDDGRRVLVDTSGAPLRAALDLPVALLKINAHELGDALGTAIDGPHTAAEAARTVLERGPRAVIVTLGAAGGVAADREGAWYSRTPPITLVSPVGSGDAVLAGAARVLLDGGSLVEALRMGVACGAANAMMLGAGVVQRADLAWLLPETEHSALTV
jgi:1-phosphofructokinase family hexose kinase